MNQADRIHPTAEGQKIVGENVWKVLKPVLVEIEREPQQSHETPDVKDLTKDSRREYNVQAIDIPIAEFHEERNRGLVRHSRVKLSQVCGH